MNLTQSQVMLIMLMVEAATRSALTAIEHATEDEVETLIESEQARKDKLMAELGGR